MTVIRTGIPQYMANLEAQRDVAIARAEAAEKKVAELKDALREALIIMEVECDRDFWGDEIETVRTALNKSK